MAGTTASRMYLTGIGSFEMARTPDAFDMEYECEYGSRDEIETRCKYCCERGLFWEEARGEHNQKKWVLVDEDGNIHACKKGPYAPANLAEDF